MTFFVLFVVDFDAIFTIMASTTTTKGLSVVSAIVTKTFEISRKITDDFKENITIYYSK